MTYTERNFKFIEEIKFAKNNHKVSVVKKRIKTIFNIKKNFETRWQAIKNQQFKWYNLKHKKLVFSLKDKVWLNAKNIWSKWSFKKLNYKYHDFFEIIKLINKRFYKLKLSDFMNRIHDVFHVFLLKSYKKNNDFNSEPPSIEIEKNTEWEIKKILNNWTYHDQFQYFVRWLGYSFLNDSWLSVTEMKNALDLIREFHEKYSNKLEKLSEKKRKNVANMQKKRLIKKKKKIKIQILFLILNFFFFKVF